MLVQFLMSPHEGGVGTLLEKIAAYQQQVGLSMERRAEQAAKEISSLALPCDFDLSEVLSTSV